MYSYGAVEKGRSSRVYTMRRLKALQLGFDKGQRVSGWEAGRGQPLSSLNVCCNSLSTRKQIRDFPSEPNFGVALPFSQRLRVLGKVPWDETDAYMSEVDGKLVCDMEQRMRCARAHIARRSGHMHILYCSNSRFIRMIQSMVSFSWMFTEVFSNLLSSLVEVYFKYDLLGRLLDGWN